VEPDHLDLARRDNDHIAFGLGIHHCLGAPLARLEGQIAFAALVERLPRLRVVGRPEWRPTILGRGLDALPVSVE
jgi:cytochrome P450